MHLELRIFGRTVEFSTKALPPLQGLSPSSGGSGWWPFVRESFTGAWQQNVTVEASTALTYSAVYACVSLIAGDIAKLCLRLVQQDSNGIWTETDSPAFSPVLRKPNRYQNIIKFVEQWIVSKLTRGNAYVLKQRDIRGVVTGLYLLDPSRVKALVSSDGAVYYEISRDQLSQVDAERIVVPAREIIHDIMCALYHPLIGVTPIYACGVAATQGLAIQNNSQKFFSTGSSPSGILTAPGAISKETADRLKSYFETNFSGDNIGKVAIAGDGLKYEQLTMNAVDAQLIDQLKWTAETVCSCFHVPPYMIGVGPPPPYANVEPLIQAYYAQCIQSLITSMEKCLDEGLGLDEKKDGIKYGVEFDIDDLIWMDTATRMKAAGDGIRSGLSVDEVRKKYHGVAPVNGGAVVYMQEQNHSLEALAAIDKAKIRDAEQPVPVPQAPPPDQAAIDAANQADEQQQMAAAFTAIRRKSFERWGRRAA